MKAIDHSIVVAGGGLAGALVCWHLQQTGLHPLWIDAGFPHSATDAGAGIMNPVTGRKFVLSWRFQALLDEALATYRALEQSSGRQLLFPMVLDKTLYTPADEEQWAMRATQEGYCDYMHSPDPVSPPDYLRDCPAQGRIAPLWRVDMPEVVAAVQDILGPPQSGQLLPDRRIQLADGIRILPPSTTLIQCTGAQAHPECTPYLAPYKGEALLIHSPDLPEDRILHHKLKVVPYGGQRFWVGTYDGHQWATEGPTPAGHTQLEALLQRWFNIRYTVLEGQAGLRPSSRRRRPFVGSLPGQTNTWVLNGLGTKGASLAPMAARALTGQLLGTEATDPELAWPWADAPH